MPRFQRIALGLLIAYAASMTLVASQASTEAWFYRDLYDRAWKPRGSHPEGGMIQAARDFGLPVTRLQYWSIRLADLRGSVLVPSIAAVALAGFCVPFLPPLLARLRKD